MLALITNGSISDIQGIYFLLGQRKVDAIIVEGDNNAVRNVCALLSILNKKVPIFYDHIYQIYGDDISLYDYLITYMGNEYAYDIRPIDRLLYSIRKYDLLSFGGTSSVKKLMAKGLVSSYIVMDDGNLNTASLMENLSNVPSYIYRTNVTDISKARMIGMSSKFIYGSIPKGKVSTWMFPGMTLVLQYLRM